MKRIITTIILILVLTQGSTLANVNSTLEDRVAGLELRVEQLEHAIVYTALPSDVGGFSGHGFTQTAPFTVTTRPFEINWSVENNGPGTTFTVGIACPESNAGVYTFGSYINSGNTTGQTWVYVEPGTYFLAVNTETYVSWNVQVGE